MDEITLVRFTHEQFDAAIKKFVNKTTPDEALQKIDPATLLIEKTASIDLMQKTSYNGMPAGSSYEPVLDNNRLM